MHPNCENLHFRAKFSRAREGFRAKSARKSVHPRGENFTKILQKFSVYGCTFFAQKSENFANFCQKPQNLCRKGFLGVFGQKFSKIFNFLGVFGKKYTLTLGSKNLKNPQNQKSTTVKIEKSKMTFRKIFAQANMAHL